MLRERLLIVQGVTVGRFLLLALRLCLRREFQLGLDLRRQEGDLDQAAAFIVENRRAIGLHFPDDDFVVGLAVAGGSGPVGSGGKMIRRNQSGRLAGGDDWRRGRHRQRRAAARAPEWVDFGQLRGLQAGPAAQRGEIVAKPNVLFYFVSKASSSLIVIKKELWDLAQALFFDSSRWRDTFLGRGPFFARSPELDLVGHFLAGSSGFESRKPQAFPH